jgi:hypothetical protein
MKPAWKTLIKTAIILLLLGVLGYLYLYFYVWLPPEQFPLYNGAIPIPNGTKFL